MGRIDIVVLGASAGGQDPLASLLETLPDDPDAAFFVATHRSLPHTLVEIFRNRCSVPVDLAVDTARIKPGNVYVCPADHNLWLEHGYMRVERSPKEGSYRPSINVLFRSAAVVYGRRVAGVLLSGMMTDGAAGLWHVKERGGVAIVQDPREAQYPSMPENAIGSITVDYVLRANAIGTKLAELTNSHPNAPCPPKVLIVEDEYFLADDVSQGLKARGYEIAGLVSSGEEAIEFVTDRLPDVILMDIRLGGTIAGTDAARIIWRRFQVPVIYLTACGDSKTLQEVQTSGAYGFVMKPFRIEAVEGAIKLALHRREREL